MDYNIMTLINRLWKHKKIVLITTTAGFILGIFLALTAKKQYDVVVKIMPEKADQKTVLGTLSSIGGALSNLQNMTDAIYPEIYPDIVRSYPFVADLMAMNVSFRHNDDSVHTNLYDYKLNYEKKGLFHKQDDQIPSTFDAVHLTRKEDRILRRIRRDIQVGVNKKTSLITIKVTSRNQQVATDLSNRIIAGLEEYIQLYYQGKAVADLEYLQIMTAQARDEYYESQARYAAAMDANQGLSSQSSRLRQQRLQSEMNLSSQLYQQISKKEQAARIKVQESKPVLAVIQPAVYPYKGHPSRMKIVFIMTFLAFAVSSVWVIFFKDELANADAEEK